MAQTNLYYRQFALPAEASLGEGKQRLAAVVPGEQLEGADDQGVEQVHRLVDCDGFGAPASSLRLLEYISLVVPKHPSSLE